MSALHDDLKLTYFQEQVCIGSLLGDMSASRSKFAINYHLSCYHSQKQIDWLVMKWQWLQPLSRPIQYCSYLDKRDGKIRSGARFHTVSAQCLTDIADLFYKDEKVIPENITKIMSHPVALACLICDDGSWDGAGISIASKQFNEVCNQRLASCLKNNYGLNTSVQNTGKYYYIRITAQSVEETWRICEPFIPEFLQYKFGGHGYHTRLVARVEKECKTCGTKFSCYESSGKRFCSRECSYAHREMGYSTRKTSIACPRCGNIFTRYVSGQETCLDCRGKPFPGEVCRVCGNQVKKHGRVYCSHRCSVIGCHIKQGHITSSSPHPPL